MIRELWWLLVETLWPRCVFCGRHGHRTCSARCTCDMDALLLGFRRGECTVHP